MGKEGEGEFSSFASNATLTAPLPRLHHVCSLPAFEVEALPDLAGMDAASTAQHLRQLGVLESTVEKWFLGEEGAYGLTGQNVDDLIVKAYKSK